MKNSISPNDCKNMFSDRFKTLSMKELGIELKHFAVGTAPEYPSFLVNQEKLKKDLIEKFSNFFDSAHSQGLEVVFLKSNYGNGKTHFIRTIHSFLSNYENVYTKRVSLKQEKTELKGKILEAVGYKTIKDCATYFVDKATEKAESDKKESVLLALVDENGVNMHLAELLYEVARNENVARQSRAVAILKKSYLDDYLKDFKIRKSDLSQELYLKVIELVCEFLHRKNCYLVIVFDEYEHVYLWKDKRAEKELYADIKLFTDNIDTYKNLFFVFAESEVEGNNSETNDDPAFVSRKKSLTYQIDSISSPKEVINLVNMIKSRYEKYYEISLSEYESEIIESVSEGISVKTNSNYRAYTQSIMRLLDEYREKLSKKRKTKGSNKNSNKVRCKPVEYNNNNGMTFKEKWCSATSMSKKSFLCESLEQVLENSQEKIIEKSKKRGIYVSKKNTETIEYLVVYTDNPSVADFNKRYINTIDIQDTRSFIVLYPYRKNLENELKSEKIMNSENTTVIFYDVDKVPAFVEHYCSNYNNEEIKDVVSCLLALEMGC